MIASDVGSTKVFDTPDGADWGYRVILVVKNRGHAGKITVKVTLFCSEGTFKHEKTANFDADEAKQIVVDFLEPTWTATGFTHDVQTIPALKE